MIDVHVDLLAIFAMRRVQLDFEKIPTSEDRRLPLVKQGEAVSGLRKPHQVTYDIVATPIRPTNT